MRRFPAALAATFLILGFASAPAAAQVAAECAGYDPSGFARPVSGQLPVGPWSSDADIAAFAMPFALMTEDPGEREDDDILPYGYFQGPDSREILTGADRLQSVITGFYAVTFIHCTSRAVVIVYASLSNFDPRDYVVGMVRQIAGGEAALPLTFFDRVAALYPGYALTVTGHSSGGGLASYVGGLKNVPSIAFNPVLIGAALVNPGTNQLVVRVTGDLYSDPDMAPLGGVLGAMQRFFDSPEDIRGHLFRIEPTMDHGPIWRLHWISVIIDELELMLR